MQFAIHPTFDKEITNFCKKHHVDKAWISYIKMLLTNHFEVKSTNLGVGVLFPLERYNNEYELWGIYASVPKLKRHEMPKIVFAKSGGRVVFLCGGNHAGNYITKNLHTSAVERMKEFLSLEGGDTIQV